MDHSDIITTLRTEFAIDVASCRRLPGEVDLNTLVVAHDGQRYVLKVHSPDASIAELDMQDAALAHVSATACWLVVLDSSAADSSRPTNSNRWHD